MNGLLGYIKANKLVNEYIVRQDMEIRPSAQKIKIDKNLNGNIIKNGEKISISIKQYFKTNNNQIYINTDVKEEENEIWAIISQNEFEDMIKSYKERTQTIDKIVELLLEKNIKGIYIDFNNIKDYNTFKRFVIEMTPKLREVGIKTCLKLNNKIKKADFINIVDYII